MTLSVAIIDVIGLAYDGDTLSKRGLGGSESAVIMISKELKKIGFDVTVYNNCVDTDCRPGIYDGVEYIDVKNINVPRHFDVMISSRTFIPFVQPHLYGLFQPDQYGRMHDCASFKKLSSDYRVMWMHDTFCLADEYLEDLLRDGTIHELFTLTDFHTTYVTNNDHGRKRIFEVMRDHMWQTRNGVNNYIPHVDISKKDRNLFVYNASVTKGMIPLVTKVWPKLKQRLPEAKLTIIGGYYRFRDNAPPDEQEKVFRKMVEEPHNDITFTGIITQSEIAEIYAKANMFLYPGAFPETHGISTLESLTYNTPLVATRFGALGETAIEQASYFIDYAVVPTPLSPWINEDIQVNKFVDKVMEAYGNPYLHQQKQNYCNVIKDINGWDSIALQWKQHIFSKLKKILPVDEFRKVKIINNKVHRVFGRRFANMEEFGTPKKREKHFTFIVPFYNAENYIADMMISVANQDYDNYKVYMISDASTDNSIEVINKTLDTFTKEQKMHFTVMQNAERKGASYNQNFLIKHYCLDEETIIVLLDGDDKLYSDNTILDFYNDVHDVADFTYGSCWSMADNIPLVAQEYPPQVKKEGRYREHKFNWGIPYTHLRTFKSHLFKDVPDSAFKDENGNWFMAGGDNPMFYEVIERCSPDRVKAVQEITCFYNDLNPINDYKVNGHMQNQVAAQVQGKSTNPSVPPLAAVTDRSCIPAKKETFVEALSKIAGALDHVPDRKKKILIAVPTAKYIEPETFKAIYDLHVPDGYEVDFQFFYGYRIDQIRNLIASWVEKGYDYLFSVDSDIVFAPDTLNKMIEHDVDMVSGIYRQRKPEQVLEIFVRNEQGGVSNVTHLEPNLPQLVEIAACGFGCVLIKKEVFTKIGYPHFEYHVALNHGNTVSEDVDFCTKATNTGSKIFCDTTIICKHLGSTVYEVGKNTL